jgi:GDPmannose 4,6-dehydratase
LASLVYFFNHESALRPPEFFFPKLIACLVGAIRGQAEPTTFGTLDFCRDWGSAEEYMDLAVDMLEKAPGEDFVLATGRCTQARELVRKLFAEYGLDYRLFIREQATAGAPSEPYVASTAKLRDLVGRTPQVGIEEVVRAMVREALGAGQGVVSAGDRTH